MFNVVKRPSPMATSVTLETGEIARQAGGAVVVSMEDTVVLVTVVAAKNAKPGQDFFPTVDYQEKVLRRRPYPRRLLQREGRPSEKETPDLPPDRPSHPPAVPGRFLQRSPGSRHRLSLNPEIDADIPPDWCFRRPRHLRCALQWPHRRCPRRLHQRPVRACAPPQQPARGNPADLVVGRYRSAVLMVEPKPRSCPRKSCSALSSSATPDDQAINQLVEVASGKAGMGNGRLRPRRRALLSLRLKDICQGKLGSLQHHQ